MASREYSSTDTGAPQMGGNAAGSLLGVLRAVLVDGYGDKQPLGWELMFVDAVNHIHVYRPRSGSRMFLKVVDDGTIRYSTSIFRAAFMSYENMFSANQGIHPCPPEQNYRNGQAGCVTKTGENNITTQKWKIIGDEEGFYLITFPYSSRATNYNSVGCWFYFGSYPCFGHDTSKNMYNWAMLTAPNNAYSCSSGHSSDGTACIMRNPYSQVKGCRNIYIGSLFGYAERSAVTNVNITQDASGRYVNELANINGLPVYSSVYIRDQAYATNILGVLPGMFDVICIGTYKQNQIYYEELDENNKLVCIPVAPSNSYVEQNHCRLAFLVGEKFRYVF